MLHAVNVGSPCWQVATRSAHVAHVASNVTDPALCRPASEYSGDRAAAASPLHRETSGLFSPLLSPTPLITLTPSSDGPRCRDQILFSEDFDAIQDYLLSSSSPMVSLSPSWLQHPTVPSPLLPHQTTQSSLVPHATTQARPLVACSQSAVTSSNAVTSQSSAVTFSSASNGSLPLAADMHSAALSLAADTCRLELNDQSNYSVARSKVWSCYFSLWHYFCF